MNFNQAEFYTSYGRLNQLPPSERIEIAFSGRSNVGKSSLINKLLKRRSLAGVSGVPGKAAKINFSKLGEIFLADLPGYGYAKVSQGEKNKWSELIGGYLGSGRNLALVFQLVDFRHPPSKDDINMINFFIDSETPFVVVLTKADKLSKTQRAERLKALQTEIPCAEDITMVEFSSQTGEGVEQLREIIEDIAENE